MKRFFYALMMFAATSVCIVLLSITAMAAGPWSVLSPDGSIKFNITQAGDGSLSYTVTKGGSTVIETSTLGINTGLADFKAGLVYSSSSSITINESYPMPVGKKSTYVNYCNQLTLKFTKNTQQMNLIIRAYNDGIAYRYNLPTRTTVSSEYSQFNLPDGSCWIGDQNNSYEMDYTEKTVADATGTTALYSMCPVFKPNTPACYVWISEADIYDDYCNSNLKASGSRNGVFNVVNSSGNPPSTGTNNSPWRVAAIGSSLSTLVQTTIVENLNPPNEVGDTSWAAPGGCAWTWLNGDPCNSLEVAKQYIDFAASMGWKYYLADEGWSESWAPEMCQYANSKNVGVILWSHHNMLLTQADVDTLLPKWASWGAKGIKVDFFDGESQLENQERDRIAKKAAEVHLNVNFHGTVKPTGQQRKWPHILSWEAVNGNENAPNSVYFNTIPFTRCIAGPSDITPVMTWSSKTGSFELATALTIMSNYICYAGKPTYYDTFAGKEFLKVLPGAFDETRFIEGSVGSYFTVARKKGSDWFVGGTTVKARTASVPLSFLGQGTYIATIYKDKTSGNQIAYSTQNVTNTTVLSIPCLDDGGFAIYISTRALPAPAGSNLAAGKAVSASSEWSSSYGAACVTDSSNKTRWNSAAGTTTGQWIQVDLGVSTTFNTVVTKLSELDYDCYDRIKGYRIQSSNDGITWSTLLEGTSWYKGKADTFAPVTARYVRFYVTEATECPSISEFEVYNLGSNLAAGKTATASSEWNSNYSAVKAVDGNPDTRWNTAWGKTAGEYLIVDLGTNTKFNTLVTDENKYYQRIQGYTIDYSTDGVNWTPVVNGKTVGTYKFDRLASQVTARYVRLKITSADDCPTINEFAIYNW